MDQQRVLSKVSLNRNHVKQGHASMVDENVVTRSSQEPNSPRGSGVCSPI